MTSEHTVGAAEGRRIPFADVANDEKRRRRRPSVRHGLLLVLAMGGVWVTPGRAQEGPAPTISVKNHYAFTYDGPVAFQTDLPDGVYRGEDGVGEVRAGQARVAVALPTGRRATLKRVATSSGASPFGDGPLTVIPDDGALTLRWNGTPIGALELGLTVQPGTAMGPEEAVGTFDAMRGPWMSGADGSLRAVHESGGTRAEVVAHPYAGGWVDVKATLTRLPGAPDTAYVALVRRVTSASGGAAEPMVMRWNGRTMTAADSPATWDRDFWYTRGLDWARWDAGGVSFVVVNGFTPGPPLETSPGRWREGSHFRVWERAQSRDGARYFLSEVAGPNPGQATSRYMPVTPYAAPAEGAPVVLRFRLAAAERPPTNWAESQLHGFAGFRAVEEEKGKTRVDLGVPAVTFGVSYFPYSTFAENFGFYRTPGLDRDTFWPISATMWRDWRAYRDRIRTDLRIIRAMGFERIRQHHLELLQQLPEAEVLAYLDFVAEESRDLGLTWLIDTEGPEAWVALVASRYRELLTGVEIENEVLIPGIHPEDAERWTALYHAAKAAAPEADVFLTGVGNEGMIDQARRLGVPIDRVGLHAYKHGPQWPEAFSSHVLASAGVASDRGLPLSLSEFNWKSLTRLDPETRRLKAAEIYDAILTPRALPEVYLFQFQETISVNPAVARNGTRHYELVGLDRRPKPEAFELMQRIRQYGRPDAPVDALPIEVEETAFRRGVARASFGMTNRTDVPVTVRLTAECPGFTCAVTSRRVVALAPGASVEGTTRLDLPADASPGLYHAFVRAEYDDGTAWGWARASNPGRPHFDPEPMLSSLATYPQGREVVERMAWDGPLAVVYGEGAPVLEMEMATFTAGTLQAATGRPVFLSSTADLPDDIRHGPLVLVGTPETNPLIGPLPDDSSGRGVVYLDGDDPGPLRLWLTGRDSHAVHAAAMDLVLRFWPNAKDSATRLTGVEPNPMQPPESIPENEEGANGG